MEDNIIYEKSVQFSRLLIDSLKNFDSPSYKNLVYQLRRSGSAIGASIAEAGSAESHIEFIHKMKVADKEVNETIYWLAILEKDFPHITSKLNEPVTEVKRILKSILISSTKRLKAKNRSH